MVPIEPKPLGEQLPLSSFYERYWKHPEGSPEGNPFALNERMCLLRKALSGIPVNAPILDAGCGSGEFVRFLSELGYDVAGIDISPTAISKARVAAPDVRLSVASLEQGVPFGSGPFAAVWCTEVLEHLFDIHAALSELNRVILPDGLLVLTVPYHGRIKNLLIALGGFERHYNPYLSHIRFFTRKTLEACLVNAGFAASTWTGVGRCWPLWKSLFVIARKKASPLPPPEITG